MKVLIISHNPISTHQNMGKTLLSLFDDFERDELCQLYVYPSVSDVEKCSSYFRITDKDVLRSYYKLRVDCGEVLPDNDCHKIFLNKKDEKLYSRQKRKGSSRKIIRDLMWKFSKWYNDALRKWLDKENPNCVFLAPGESKFIYDIALKISKERKIPLITYICDDYYFVKKPKAFINRLQHRLLQSTIEKCLQQTAHIISICDELSECYFEKFAKPTTTVMTGTNYPVNAKRPVCDKPQSITYMGNLSCGRNKSLADVGRILDDINSQNGTEYSLRIFTSANTDEILFPLKDIKSVKFCGYVTGKEFVKEFHSSELLLHVEGFDEENIDRVKHSISTKIADSLGSGIPLIAYAPESVSSMKHLINNDCAIIIKEKNELKNSILEAFNNFDARKNAVKKGLEIASKYHIPKDNSRRLYDIIQNIIVDKA